MTIANEKIAFEVKFARIYIDGALLNSLSIKQHMQPFIYRIQCKIREPSPIRGNELSHLSLEDFKETDDESLAWESFEKKLSPYSFLKYLVQENDIDVHVDLPGLKNFLSFSETDTDKSEFCSIAVLDETADSKATVLKTLNILHKRFRLG